MAENRTVLGVLCNEGHNTGDSRRIGRDALRWNLPLPLRRQTVSREGHEGSVTVGSIDEIKRDPAGNLLFKGKLFSTPEGDLALNEMATRYSESGLKYGISIDPDDIMFEEDGDVLVFVSGRLRGATLVDIPAYASAWVMLESQVEPTVLVAAGAPRTDLPRAWFTDPHFERPTPMTVTDDGRVFGHAALWDSCHIAYDTCVRPPKSHSGYAYFNSGLIEAEGTQIPVGHITMGTGHADARLSAKPAAEHYDNTGCIVADITAGEDRFGIWYAGALRDGIAPEQARELQATGVSGDWRTINGSLEMVAVLSVPVSGFPVPRVKALVAGGQVQTLVASATFDSEANVENGDDMVSEGAPVEETDEPVVADLSTPGGEEALPEPGEDDDDESPKVDVPEVAPEVVAAEMGDPVHTEEEPEPEIDMAAEIALLRAELAELKAALAPVAEEAPAEETEEIEPLPAVERTDEDMAAALAALDAQVKPSVAEILAGLDAKVG